MSFTYTRDIPFGTHSPSTDQPNMQTNTNSIDNLLLVDHVSFNEADSGKHNHVTFPATQSDPALVNFQTQIYPKSFGTGPTYLETYTAAKTNGGVQINGYLPFVKCIVRFVSIGSDAPITQDMTYINANIGSIVESNSQKTITVTFAGALPSTSYYIFFSDPTVAGISITRNTGSIVFNRGIAIPVGTLFSFMVI